MKRYVKYARTGGGANALDGIDGAGLLDGEEAIVYKQGLLTPYLFDDDGALTFTADDDNYVAPDVNPGNGLWIKQRAAFIDEVKNPLTMAQGIYSSTWPAGAGIKVADNVNLNMGTGNFSIRWRGSLPDWTPATNQSLASKRTGGIPLVGWGFNVVASSGAIRVIIGNGGDGYIISSSTVAPGLIDGAWAEIVASVTRETAGTAGSVVFYLNGNQLGAAVAIPAASPIGMNNSQPVVLLDNNPSGGARLEGTIGAFTIFNYALSPDQVRNLYRYGIDPVDKCGSQTEMITAQNDRDFSSGTIGNWVVGGTTGGTCVYDAGPGGEQTGLITVGAGAGGGNSSTAAYLSTTAIATMTPNKRYCVAMDIYIPSGQHWTGIAIAQSGLTGVTAFAARDANLTTTDAWQRIWKIYQIATDVSGSIGINCASATPGDMVYIDNISVTQAGAVLDLESEGVQPSPGQWLDASSNKLHALQPASGTEPIRPMRTFELRDTLSWSGTHEAKYVGGNQAVLPVGCYIEEIIGVVAGATVEDIVIGDGADNDRWVAATTGLSAGTVSFTLANRASDGTNYKVVVDPDANFTGSIAFTIRGIILQ